MQLVKYINEVFDDQKEAVLLKQGVNRHHSSQPGYLEVPQNNKTSEGQFDSKSQNFPSAMCKVCHCLQLS